MGLPHARPDAPKAAVPALALLETSSVLVESYADEMKEHMQWG
jgi:hypothetical protein